MPSSVVGMRERRLPTLDINRITLWLNVKCGPFAAFKSENTGACNAEIVGFCVINDCMMGRDLR